MLSPWDETPSAAIENATVYTEEIYDDGRKSIMRYFGKERDLVEKYAEERKAAVDEYRSPSLTPVSPYQDGYACLLIIYSLE